MSDTTPTFSDEQKAQLTEFVASQMFSNLQFNQVLVTIEGQCRQQAQQIVSTADDETLTKINQDLVAAQAENQLFGGATIQEGAAEVPGT